MLHATEGVSRDTILCLKGANFISVNYMHKPPKEDNLSTKD